MQDLYWLGQLLVGLEVQVHESCLRGLDGSLDLVELSLRGVVRWWDQRLLENVLGLTVCLDHGRLTLVPCIQVLQNYEEVLHKLVTADHFDLLGGVDVRWLEYGLRVVTRAMQVNWDRNWVLGHKSVPLPWQRSSAPYNTLIWLLVQPFLLGLKHIISVSLRSLTWQLLRSSLSRLSYTLLENPFEFFPIISK